MLVTVEEIVKKYLREHGHAGLCSDQWGGIGGCSCLVDNPLDCDIDVWPGHCMPYGGSDMLRSDEIEADKRRVMAEDCPKAYRMRSDAAFLKKKQKEQGDADEIAGG